MRESYASLDAHAYIDNSLAPSDRAAFEAALRRDAKLRARVEAWQAQSEAIRLAFGASPRSKLTSSLGRHSNENHAPPPPRSAVSPARSRAVPPREVKAAPAPASFPWRLPLVGAVVLIGAWLSFPGGPPDPRQAMMQRADSALRAIAPLAATRLDFVSDDSRAVAAWLAPRFAKIDADRLAPPGWSLLGVRVLPGLASAAALVVYEDAMGERAGLLLEPTDALPALPPIGRGDADEVRVAGVGQGFAYAAVGPRHAGVAALAPVRAE